MDDHYYTNNLDMVSEEKSIETSIPLQSAISSF